MNAVLITSKQKAKGGKQWRTALCPAAFCRLLSVAVVARHNGRTQLSLDSAIDFPKAIGAGDGYRIPNRLGVRSAVTNYRDALYTQQRRSPVLGIVEPLLKLL
jgi:hypothetical protein